MDPFSAYSVMLIEILYFSFFFDKEMNEMQLISSHYKKATGTEQYILLYLFL